MLQEWQQGSPTEEYAKAVYYLQKELGLSHADIFGGREVVWRDGRFEEVTTRGMNIFTFMAYVELMEMDAERQKREHQKAKTKAKVGNNKMAG